MKTFLINLERSQDRLRNADALLSRAGMPYERIDAVDGASLDQSKIPGLDQAKATAIFSNPLTAGEIGCYLSHKRAVERIVTLGLPHALVLEDDFEFPSEFPSMLEDLEAFLKSDKIGAWDAINLRRPAKKIYRRIPQFQSKNASSHLCRAFYYPVTTTGVIWSQAGAQRFLKDAHQIYEPVDCTLRRLLCRSGRGLAFGVPVLTHGEVDSTISAIARRELGKQKSGLGLRAKRYIDAAVRFLLGPISD